MSSQVANGVRYYLGPRAATDENDVKSIETYGDRAQVEIVFSYDDLPDPTDTNYIWNFIPANSIILAAWYDVLVPFAGGTSYDIGFQRADGTEIDNNGLWSALALSAINAEHERGLSTGASLGTASIYDAYFYAVATGTFTAGQIRIVVEYAPPSDVPYI